MTKMVKQTAATELMSQPSFSLMCSQTILSEIHRPHNLIDIHRSLSDWSSQGCHTDRQSTDALRAEAEDKKTPLEHVC